MQIEEFITARIAEERLNIECLDEPWQQDRLLKAFDFMEHVIEWHKNWPVLVQEPMKVEDVGTILQFQYRITQRMDWLTQEEYRKTFGDSPPTAPLLARMAAIWKNHPDFDASWESS